MRTGYFDDIKRFRDSRGKVIETSKELVPAAIANAFPETKVPEFWLMWNTVVDAVHPCCPGIAIPPLQWHQSFALWHFCGKDAGHVDILHLVPSEAKNASNIFVLFQWRFKRSVVLPVSEDRLEHMYLPICWTGHKSYIGLYFIQGGSQGRAVVWKWITLLIWCCPASSPQQSEEKNSPPEASLSGISGCLCMERNESNSDFIQQLDKIWITD